VQTILLAAILSTAQHCNDQTVAAAKATLPVRLREVSPAVETRNVAAFQFTRFSSDDQGYELLDPPPKPPWWWFPTPGECPEHVCGWL
jgi:hypothetical protein